MNDERIPKPSAEFDPDKNGCFNELFPTELPLLRTLKLNGNFVYLEKMIRDAVSNGGTATVTVNGKSPDSKGEITITAEDVNAAAKTHTHPNATDEVSGMLSKEDFIKLGGVEEGATKNSRDSFLLERANHTGMQSPETITGLAYAIARIPERTAVTGIISTPGDSLILSINDVEIYAYYNPDDINGITQVLRCKQGKDVTVDFTYISTDGNGTNYPYGMDMAHLTREGQIFNVSRDTYSFSYNSGYLRENRRLWRLGAFFSQVGRECSLWAERII